jgi:hypothetical protein
VGLTEADVTPAPNAIRGGAGACEVTRTAQV